MYQRKPPPFIWNMFHEKKSHYDLRSKNLLKLPQTNNIRYGNDSLIVRGIILWNKIKIQNKITSKTSVRSFKKCIKRWSGEDCNCKIYNDKNTTFNDCKTNSKEL